MEYGYREQCFYIFWEQKKGAEWQAYRIARLNVLHKL
jgi:hypothetical protein